MQGGGRVVKFDIDLADIQLRRALTNIGGGSFGDEEVKAITLSGDGEPTALLDFEGVIRRVIAVRDEFGLVGAKVVVISNASGLHRQTVRKGLNLLDDNNGELWAKLDAGTEDYFQRVAQTRVPFRRILDNLLAVSQERSIQVQTCFMNINGQMPDRDELGVYADRINHLAANGGRVQAIQLYTIARPPIDTKGYDLSSLTTEQMDQVAQTLQGNIAVPIEVYK